MKSINWSARIAREDAAQVRANLRTALSYRKQYTAHDRGLHYIAELPISTRRTLGSGNSETLALAPSS